MTQKTREIAIPKNEPFRQHNTRLEQIIQMSDDRETKPHKWNFASDKQSLCVINNDWVLYIYIS